MKGPYDARKLGAVIAALRTHTFLSQEELAQAAGGKLRQSDISEIEKGTVRARRDRLSRIAAALGKTLEELIDLSSTIATIEVVDGKVFTDLQVKQRADDPNAPAGTLPNPLAYIPREAPDDTLVVDWEDAISFQMVARSGRDQVPQTHAMKVHFAGFGPANRDRLLADISRDAALLDDRHLYAVALLIRQLADNASLQQQVPIVARPPLIPPPNGVTPSTTEEGPEASGK